MHTQREIEYLLKAVDAFKRRLIVVSPHFEILAANCHLEDTPDEELVGRLCHKALYGIDHPCEDCAIKEVIRNGKPAIRTKRNRELDLDNMPCLYAYPIYEGEEIDAFVSMDFDLPTRGEIERELQRSNALLRNLILSSVDGVMAADMKGKVFIFNETAAEIFGYSVEEALDELDIRDVYPDRLELTVMQNLRSEDFGGRGKLRSFQVDVVHKDGHLIPINLNAAVVYEDNREVATIGFFHDMREILRMRAELEKTQVQLLQAEKMASLGKLAAGVAHQHTNPLGGITLLTKQVMEDYDLAAGARDDLNRVLRDAERCRDTVKELLEFTRQTRHLMRPNDINRALTRTLFLLENQSIFQDIRIEKQLEEDLPPVYSDIQQINHLFMNIILNAAQAMGGKGSLSVKTCRITGDRVRIDISDTGPGIPSNILPHVFEPFFTTKDEGEGTGLGLSLAYGIVENHGGKIKAENNDPQGATFVIELPITPKSIKGADSGQQNR